MWQHHGGEEVHPGRWKGMESINNETKATGALRENNLLNQILQVHRSGQLKSSNNLETKEERNIRLIFKKGNAKANPNTCEEQQRN